MTGSDEDKTPKRFQTVRPNPFRDIFPWVAIVVGLIQAVRGGVELAHGAGPFQLFLGLGLAALGIIVFLIGRWQARRGL